MHTQSVGGLMFFSMSLCLISTSACGSIAAPTETATPTQPKPTSTPTATYTPSSTPTLTPIPTPIGGGEPKVSFVGKDPQGNYGIYVDGFFTNNPEKIAPVSVSNENTGFLQMKWSPDGIKLIFVNGEPANWSFFLYQTTSREVQELTKVPNKQDVIGELIWSEDGNEIFFMTATRSTPLRRWKLNLSRGEFSETNEHHGVNSYFHVNSSINCDFSSFPPSIQEFGFSNSICFYPELNAYGGLRRSTESTDLVLLSQTGEVGEFLVKFPAEVYTNGFVGLLLSPDKSYILIVGDGGIEITGHPFAYLAQFTSLPLDKSDPKLFESDSFDSIHVYG